MWLKRTKPLLGIDIGSHAIKLVRLSSSGGSFQLLNLALLPLPPEAVAEGVINDIPAVQATLQRLTTLESIAEKDAALALSGHSVIVKKVSMARMSEEELANAMPYEAEQHIPFDVYDVNTDFQILSADEGDGGRSAQMEVLLAAAKKGRIEELCLVARGAKLNPVVIDVDMLALMNGFELNYPEVVRGHVIALIHLGASLMTVLVIKDGVNTFQRDIALGGNQYTAALESAVGLRRDEAEAVKLGGRPWSPLGTAPFAALRTVTDEVVIEIRRSIEFYLASAGGDPIERAYLSGGSACMKGLDQVLSARLKLPVEPLDPFRRIAIPAKAFDPAYVAAMGPMAAVAVGLATRQKGDR
jgi:type IV pilus assembly protein PilM